MLLALQAKSNCNAIGLHYQGALPLGASYCNPNARALPLRYYLLVPLHKGAKPPLLKQRARRARSQINWIQIKWIDNKSNSKGLALAVQLI